MVEVFEDDRIVLTDSFTPSSASAFGDKGTISWDGNYIYISTSYNSWRRLQHLDFTSSFSLSTHDHDDTYLKLDQTTPETLTASPVLNWLTVGSFLYLDSNKYLTSSANSTYDETTAQLKLKLSDGSYSTFQPSLCELYSLENGTNKFHFNNETQGAVTIGQDVDGNFCIANGWEISSPKLQVNKTTGKITILNGLLLSTLTSTRIPYATTNGELIDSSNLTFDGTNITLAGIYKSKAGDSTTGQFVWTTDPVNVSLNAISIIPGTTGRRIVLGSASISPYSLYMGYVTNGFESATQYGLPFAKIFAAGAGQQGSYQGYYGLQIKPNMGSGWTGAYAVVGAVDTYGLVIAGQKTTAITLCSKAAASQTADIFRCEDSSANSLFAIDSSGNLNLADAKNIIIGTTTGTKIGTATTQKIGFWNTTPIVQPTTAIAAATFTANTSAINDDTATFDGYTIGQVVKALRNVGILA